MYFRALFFLVVYPVWLLANERRKTAFSCFKVGWPTKKRASCTVCWLAQSDPSVLLSFGALLFGAVWNTSSLYVAVCVCVCLCVCVSVCSLWCSLTTLGDQRGAVESSLP